MTNVPSDLKIAQAANKLPIVEVAAGLGIPEDDLIPYGHDKAKNQYSFSTEPLLLGAPTGHDVPIREIRLATGAEFVVVICGDMMTMPGLPRQPSSESISVNENKEIVGLF